MATTFAQTDDAANGSAIAAHCSGNSDSSDPESNQASVGGTAGTTERTHTPGNLAADLNGVWMELDNIDDYDGASGTWTVPINITTANHQITLDEIHICRVNSSYVSQETVASATGLVDNLGSTGEVSNDLTQAGSITIDPGDKIIIIFAFDNAQDMVQSIGYTPDADILAPGTISEAGITRDPPQGDLSLDSAAPSIDFGFSPPSAQLSIAAAAGNAPAYLFNASDDYLRIAAGDLTVADTTDSTISFWVKRAGGLGDEQRIFESALTTSARVVVTLRPTNNRIRCDWLDSSAATLGTVEFDPGQDISDTTTWHHVYMTIDGSTMGGAGDNAFIYLDGVDVTTILNAGTADLLADFTRNWNIGRDDGNLFFLDGAMAEFWMDNVYLEPTANIGKFYDSGKAVPLGADGSTPTGSQPWVCLNSNTWSNNTGDQTDFTENGTGLTSVDGPELLGGTSDTAPSLDFGFPGTQGDLTLDSVAPEVIAPVSISPPQGDLVLDSVAPVRFEQHTVLTPQGGLTLDSAALSLDFGFPGVQGNLTLDSVAPVRFEQHGITAPQGDLVIDSAAVSLGLGVPIPQGNLVIDSIAAVRFEQHNVAVPQGGLVLDSAAPSLDFGFPVPQDDLILDSVAPTVLEETPTANHARAPPQGDMVLDSVAPSLDFGFPGAAGNLTLDSVAPTVFHEHYAAGPQGDLALATAAPSLDFGFPVPSANLVLSTAVATVQGGNVAKNPPQANLVLDSVAPDVSAPLSIAVPQGNLTLSTTTPAVQGGDVAKNPAQADLTFSSTAPAVGRGDNNIVVPQADLALSTTALFRGGTGIIQASRFDAMSDALTISSLTGAIDGTDGTFSVGIRWQPPDTISHAFAPPSHDFALVSSIPDVVDSSVGNIASFIPTADLLLSTTSLTVLTSVDIRAQTLFYIGTDDDFGLKIELLSDGLIRAIARQVDDTVVFICTSGGYRLPRDLTRRHLHIHWSGTACSIKVSGVDVSENTAGSAGDIDYTNKVTVGASDDTSDRNRLNADLAEIFFEDTEITDSERFRHSPSTQFRNLGSDGSLPSGSSPLVYLNNEFTSFAVNKGTGGNFTTEGGLDEAVDFGAYTGSVLIEVPQGNLTLSGSVPTAVEETPSANHTRTPPQGDLTISATAPVRLVDHLPAVSQGDLILTTTAAVRLVDRAITVPQGNLSLSTTAPARLIDRAVAVPQGDLTLSTTAPVRLVDRATTVPQGDLILSTAAATSIVDIPIIVPQGDLVLSTAAPTRAEAHNVIPPQGGLVLSTTAPARLATEAVAPPQADLALSATVPARLVDARPAVPQADLVLSTTAPTVNATTSDNLVPAAADLTLSTTAPAIQTGFAPPTTLAAPADTAVFPEENTMAEIPQETVVHVFSEEKTNSQFE